ncbi:hypothetical protein CDD82_6206 [Ophiocordyceps australis]|uniref:F-box domain-containing protein n=1 Tax=Ophiocordyceps australis TaxID=1399860 RepID=A0A2C5ZSN7_9HYPO|nr:hypothetical protein CDD82_6206 [Ophiocordyceps australis]
MGMGSVKRHSTGVTSRLDFAKSDNIRPSGLMMDSLDRLPDHVLLDIAQHLDTARDVCHVGRLSRRTQRLMQMHGWRAFVGMRFPSMAVAADETTQWRAVAQQLTRLDRCWEKRGFRLHLFVQDVARRQARRGQSVAFQGLVDAALVDAGQTELLACGVGEELVLRWRDVQPDRAGDWLDDRPDDWLGGQRHGYAAGQGDVTALSVCRGAQRPAVVVGRANGDVGVHSAAVGGGALGSPSTKLLWPTTAQAAGATSPGRTAITCMAWNAQSQLAACGRDTFVTLYHVDAAQTQIRPRAALNVSKPTSPASPRPLLHCLKFVGDDAVACGIGSATDALQCAKIRPTGLDLCSPCYTATEQEGKQSVRAMEPIASNPHLLLTAWSNGAYRLLDMRTPARHDVWYRDQFQPFEAAHSLLAYGLERFVGGGHSEPVLRLFDFRWPKPYHHFNALPCSSSSPRPGPPADVLSRGRDWQGHDEREASSAAPSHCDYTSGKQCNWHKLSALPAWRPDSTLFLGLEPSNAVFCLSKATDCSDSFYCGLRGGIMEVSLSLSGDTAPSASRRVAAPPGWKVQSRAQVALMETGISCCPGGNKWDQCDAIAPTQIWQYLPGRHDEGMRLDSAWGRRRQDETATRGSWQ